MQLICEKNLDSYIREIDKALYLGLAILGAIGIASFITLILNDGLVEQWVKVSMITLSCVVAFSLITVGLTVTVKLHKVLKSFREKSALRILTILVTVFIGVIFKIAADIIFT